MNYNERLKELKEEIELIKDIQHNNGMKGAAKSLQKERLVKTYLKLGIKI